jgi:uncharacterized protein (TIGR03435 family)
MKAMLLTAYDAKNYQISGPSSLVSWLDTERYDVIVKVPAGATKEQVNVMWQNLLAERFGLTVRHEPKEFQVQELVIAKGGSKLKDTSWDAATPSPEGPPKMEKGELRSPGLVALISMGPEGASEHTVGRAQPISKLTEMLSNQLGHPVLDKTGLTGKYDFTIEFAVNLIGAPAASPDSVNAPGSSLAEALQQQLGLRLVAGKANIAGVVIDRLNKVPTEN